VVWEDSSASRLSASFVSANWFAEMGYGAAIGRVFIEGADDRTDAAPMVVVSDQLWRTRLGADPDVVGREVRLNGRMATIIGVAHARFPDLDLDNPKLWLPIGQTDYFEPGTALRNTWRSSHAELYGRLRPGVSSAAAKESLRSTAAALARAHPEEFKPDEWFEPATAADRFRSEHDRRQIWTVAVLVGGLTLLVLAVASANLGNLVLSHAIGRLREFSVRAALGATRWRILRQILLECGLLAASGTAGGVVLGQTSARVFASVMELPPYLDFTPDWRLFAAAFAIASVATLAFGLIPAWMVTRRDLVRGMKDGGQQMSAGLARARFRLTLVTAQVAGCCALLIVAGAMARSLQHLLVADPGFKVDRVAVLDPSLAKHGIHGEAARAYWSQVKEIVAAHPDDQGLALASPEPLGDAITMTGYPNTPMKITVMHVEPAYFSVLQIPLLSGRTFEPADPDDAVVIISRRLAMNVYGTIDVAGRHFPQAESAETIVGVAADAPLTQLRASDGAEEYRPIRGSQYEGAVLVARSRGNPETLVPPLWAAARAADSRVLPMTHLLVNQYEKKLREPKLASTVAAGVALLVLTLSCLGIFGVVAYAVRVRTKEIGIRRALGADTPRVFAAVLLQLAWPLALGMMFGIAAGLVASRLLSGEPFYLAVTEPTAPVGAVIVFALAAFAAAVLPASRALRVDPITALRHE
jgi:predicted permease